ncbi:MAG: metallophosphoesterase [Chitinophagaceae bacterium]|nr:metallophosphoesterase [Chitinophagaceae bacterium]
MRKILQKLLKKPVTWLAIKLSSSPRKKQVFESLSSLLGTLKDARPGHPLIVPFEVDKGKFIILSDQHKGAKDLADDFRNTETNYLDTLQYYLDSNFTFINLGDCEELWESKPSVVVAKNRKTLEMEARFLTAGRYFRIYGNHDLEWSFDPQRILHLKPVFGPKLTVSQGLLLHCTYKEKKYSIFLAHGHQGDQRSDGNWFSKIFVAWIWTPIQRFLQIQLDRVSDSFELVDKHNILMYEWSATQKDLLFISGHTHKPVFASLDHIDRLTRQLEIARSQGDHVLIRSLEKEILNRQEEYAGKKVVKTMAKPTYFNSGCCCYSDGDLTGIEIENGFIRLVKWKSDEGKSTRIVLEESPLFYLFDLLESE